MGGGSVVALTGTFAQRVARYTGVCGSLSLDISLACAGLVLFGVCAGTETAITTLWPWKVRELAKKEREQYEGREVPEDSERQWDSVSKRDRRVVGQWTALKEDIQRFMQTILIGATISGVFSTVFTTEICGQLFGPQGIAIAAVAISLIQLTVCEILPKSMAVSNPVGFAQAVLPFFYRVSAFVYPVSRVLNITVKLALKVFGISVDTSKTPFVSDEELDIMISSAMKSGLVDAEEGMMIRSVRNLDSKTVKEVMTPLVDMVGIESNAPLAALHKLCLDTQFSRMPVYTDRFDSIVGIVNMKTLLKHSKWSPAPETSDGLRVKDIQDKPFFVPETMSLLNALRCLKEKTLAICVDEYGGTTGLVTLEDVLEEIVGEIYDPDEAKDELERTKNSLQITKLAPGRFSISAVASVDDVNEVLGIELPDGDYNSLGGFVCSVCDCIPPAGVSVIAKTSQGDVRFEVTESDERKISKIEVYSERLEAKELERLELDVSGSSGGNSKLKRRAPRNDEEDGDGDLYQVLDVRPLVVEKEDFNEVAVAAVAMGERRQEASTPTPEAAEAEGLEGLAKPADHVTG